MSRPARHGHGTRSCYQRCTAGPDGGKCDRCTAANTAYVQHRRSNGLDLKPLVQERKVRPVVPLTAEQAALVADHADLVGQIVRRMRSRSVGYRRDDEDAMVSDGTIGLIQAARWFDPGQGVPFGAVATTGIRWRIADGAQRRWRHSRNIDDSGIDDASDLTTTEEIVVGRLDALDRLSA